MFDYKRGKDVRYLIMRVWPFWVDGIKYHDQYLAEFMKDDGVSTVFACPNYQMSDYLNFANSKENSKSNDNYSLLFLKHFSFLGKPFPFQLVKFSRQIRILNPDVIHVFGISNFTSIFALIAARLAFFKGKIIFNDHSDPNERKNGFVANLYYLFFLIAYRLLIRDKLTVIVPDISTCNELMRRYGTSIKNVIKIISLGYDDKMFYSRDKMRKAELPLIIGFAGKIFPEKKLEILINAILKFSVRDVELRIAGLNLTSPSKYQSSLVKFIESTGRNNIRISKFITSPEELALFYSSLDVAIFPGSISITTFEANGCGCPIILYKSYDGLEHRVSSLRGRLFETPKQLESYINEYIEIKRRSKIDHARIEIESKKFGWSRLKAEYYREYDFNFENNKNYNR